MNFDMNFPNEGENILKRAASNERIINYNNLFFKKCDPITKNFDLFKRFGILHDLLIELLNKEISTYEAVKERDEMTSKTEELKYFISLE